MDYAENRYRATVLRWKDGDTVVLRVDLGQKVMVEDSYRLARIDAPETALRRGVTQAEKTAGLALKASLIDEFPAGTEMWIATSKAGKYGRYLVELYAEVDGEWVSLNQRMLDDGLVDPY